MSRVTVALFEPNALVATHTYSPLRLILVGESVRLLVAVNPELDSEIMMFPPSVRTVCDPSSLILLHETEGRGNPSAEHVNTA